MAEPGAVIIGSHWRKRRSELAFVTRSIAGAASRLGPVSVFIPGPAGLVEPDGAFDLVGMGSSSDLRWPERPEPGNVVVVDELTSEMTALLSEIDPRSVFYLSAAADTPHPSSWRRLHVTDTDASPWVTVLVPVNPLARLHRHHGFGFTGYQLVLSDQPGVADQPTPAVAWLSAAFPEAEIVLVAGGVAAAWKGRALRGTVAVDTRMDLWRLVAHAAVCIDLTPGEQIARECVEALRFGTPIIVPEDSGPAVTHARAGGGAVFGDPGELVAAVEGLLGASKRTVAAEAGRRYADSRYGDPDALTDRVRTLLANA